MQTFFTVALGLLIFYGLSNILSARLPPSKISKTIRNVTELGRTMSVGSQGLTQKLAGFIAGFVRISKDKHEMLENDLHTAGIAITPEMYYANAAATCMVHLAVFVFTAVFLRYTISFMMIVILPLLLLLTVQATGRQLYKVRKIVREKRRQIEMDLPRFVYCISHELNNNHDVLTILERHKDSFSADFAREIEITIVDMRSGSNEAALQRMESRVASADLSEVTRGLIKMLKGNDTRVYWETLAIRFSEIQKQILRQQAQKIPAKLRTLSFFLFLTIGMLYGVIIGTVLITNMRQLF